MKPLDDMAVIVTGAGGGLGRAYALECAAQGAAVVVNDVRPDAARAVVEEIRASGGAAEAHVGTVAAWEQACTLVRLCERAFGRVDGLVNNAAVFHAATPWDENAATLRRIVDVNVLGVMYCGALAMRAMSRRSGGSIVNIVSGAQLGIAGLSAYGATKGAVTAMTLGWALECRANGIRVNAVSPLAQTEMTPDDGRVRPDPRAVAPVVAFLLGPRAGAVSGRILRFDGRRLAAYEPLRLSEDATERAHWDHEDFARAIEAPAMTLAG